MNTLYRTLVVLYLYVQFTIAATATVAVPPALLAQHHVPYGCVPDALRYVEKLASARPDLRTELISVEMRHPDGKREPHTVVIITGAEGQRWMRDEYFGVLALPPGTPTAALPAVAARVLATHGESLAKKNPRAIPQRMRANTREQRNAAARTVVEMLNAARLLHTGAETIAAWRDGNDYYVYSAAHGTARATVSEPAPDNAVYAAIAARLGLPVPLRAETAVATR